MKTATHLHSFDLLLPSHATCCILELLQSIQFLMPLKLEISIFVNSFKPRLHSSTYIINFKVSVRKFSSQMFLYAPSVRAQLFHGWQKYFLVPFADAMYIKIQKILLRRVMAEMKETWKMNSGIFSRVRPTFTFFVTITDKLCASMWNSGPPLSCGKYGATYPATLRSNAPTQFRYRPKNATLCSTIAMAENKTTEQAEHASSPSSLLASSCTLPAQNPRASEPASTTIPIPPILSNPLAESPTSTTALRWAVYPWAITSPAVHLLPIKPLLSSSHPAPKRDHPCKGDPYSGINTQIPIVSLDSARRMSVYFVGGMYTDKCYCKYPKCDRRSGAGRLWVHPSSRAIQNDEMNYSMLGS
ncbi:uncharacterized protein BDR25DRAFT_361792 [Lindgomyces ingoldianus]|uniref:Uncharacterized protein n=1 Tax=Lindgomyces ingoldianus TaxID=673940 RepID=A0ACB6QCR5_9PLEO|nr:uncharacterized protein BDR25DRAFT_361792 [Lindgomyces ingoldianus]KAF2464290.1 hypothetical protein BDR25DRAFT_361792 [Lindgomyces ingoldianus]